MIRDYLDLADVASVQLEFFHLAYRTGNPVFAEKPMKVFRILKDLQPSNGLYSSHIVAETGESAGEFHD